MADTEFPPFAEGGPQLGPQLTHAEKAKTGHIFSDCAEYGLPAPKGKVARCEDCVARIRITNAEARAHQQVADAAWRGQPVHVDTKGPAYREIPKIDVYEAIIDVPAPAPRDVRANKFAGSCVHCGTHVPAMAGALGKNAVGKWVVAHVGTCPAGAAKAAPAGPEVTPYAGAYRLADGTIVRVQVAKQSGKPYAVALDAQGTYLGGGAKLAGAVRLSLDEAKGYGRATGTCCVCGAHLENPESVALGIGPICGGRQ